jgi:hypothetical protein
MYFLFAVINLIRTLNIKYELFQGQAVYSPYIAYSLKVGK